MPKESVSDEPSMLIDGPIPSKVIEQMSVTFLPQFLGALPRALSPLGALPYLGMSATLVEDSSTNLSRSGSTPLSRSLKEPLTRSSRSVATTDFFEGPTKPAHGPAHRRHRDRDPRPSLPQLAVARKCGVVVLLELLPKGASLLSGGEDARGPPRRRPGRYVLPLAASLKPAFEARKRDPEGARRLLPRHPVVQRTERLDPEVFRVSVHAAILARGALDLQTALGLRLRDRVPGKDSRAKPSAWETDARGTPWPLLRLGHVGKRRAPPSRGWAAARPPRSCFLGGRWGCARRARSLCRGSTRRSGG